jgi:uncharacterized protein (TIGR02391 family)
VLHYYHAFLPPHFHLWNIPFIFIAGLVGESFGALVGGGSIVTMPALLLMGLPLPEAEQRARSLRHNLAQRNIHPDVLKFCKAELLQDNYFHAVFEATKSVADKIRQMSGLTTGGAALVDEALTVSHPVLALSKLATETEKMEQTGFAILLKGIFGTFRNVTAHAPKIRWSIDEQDAMDLLTMVSYAHHKLDIAIKTGL